MKLPRMSMKSTRKVAGVSLSLVLATGMLAACSKEGGSSNKADTVIRIGVLYGDSDNESYLRQQYTDTYEMMNKNVTFEFQHAINYDDQRFDQAEPGKKPERPDTYEKMKELLSGSNPVDVIIYDYNMLRRLTQDNLLKPLDSLIQQDKFDISDYVPTVIDGIKAAGDNSLYALTPVFTSSALFYNKKMFTERGVEPPTDDMTWDDVFNKARQVASGEDLDRKFGFNFTRWINDPAGDAMSYANALQLRVFDNKAENMMVNNDQWANVWNSVISLHKDNIIPDQEFIQKYYEKNSEEGSYDPFYGDLFLKGKLGMVIGESYYINDLRKANDNSSKIKDFEMVDWDVVTLPTDPNTPGQGGNIQLGQLMSINARAQNPDGAWDFIKFINGKDWAKMKSRSLYEMTARKEFIQPIGGFQYNIDAFTKLRPFQPNAEMNENLYIDKPGIWEAEGLRYELFQKAFAGEMDVKAALLEWETKGNAALQKTGDSGGEIGIDPMPRPLMLE